MELEQGYEAQVRPRSGLAVKQGITVANSPGTIDADYRGEVMVCLTNFGSEMVRIDPLMRVAQLVINQLPAVEFEMVGSLEQLSLTKREGGGFGSTGHF